MARRFVLTSDDGGNVVVKSKHEIGSTSDRFEQNSRGIGVTHSLDVQPVYNVAMTHFPEPSKS